MGNLVTFNTDKCVKKNDVVYLPLADVAYNLGFTNRTTRYDESRPLVADKVFESVRWVRVQKYLKDIFESGAVKEEAKTRVAYLSLEKVARGLGFEKTEEKFSTTSGRKEIYQQESRLTTKVW